MSGPLASILRISRRRRTAILGILGVLLVCAVVLWSRANGRASREARSASLALDQGRTQEASVAVERLLKSSPNSADAHYLKARVAWIQKDFLTLDEELAAPSNSGTHGDNSRACADCSLRQGTRNRKRNRFSAGNSAIRTKPTRRSSMPSRGFTWRRFASRNPPRYSNAG